MEGQAQYTCITCQVVFKDADIQREHYKTDWHRYNLKRKVAEMGPVTLDVFKQKMTSHEAQMKFLSGQVKPPTGYCVPCSKSFNTQKAYENHLNSKKHKEVQAKFDKKENKEEIKNNRLNRKPEDDDEAMEDDDDDDLEMEEVDSDEWAEGNEGEPIPIEDCLFCPHHSKDLEKNLIHMTEKHSFFVPDLEFVIDLETLISYLGEKVGVGFMCLWCNEKSKCFTSLSSVQKHMVDKGHCKAKHEGNAIAEYAPFYDYTASYPEGQRRPEGSTVGENGELVDEEVELEGLDDSGYEMTLPSGAKVGHRDLMRYYKQSLNPDRQVSVHKSAKQKVMSHYRMLGWSGLTTSEAKKKARDISFMHKARQKHWMQLGTKANKLQKHWVDPTL